MLFFYICCFIHYPRFVPSLNRKKHFSRSEILKNLNICPSKDRHLNSYTCYRFYDFLQYGLMDLVKSFFKWCMIYNFNRKSQKDPARDINGLDIWYNGNLTYHNRSFDIWNPKFKILNMKSQMRNLLKYEIQNLKSAKIWNPKSEIWNPISAKIWNPKWKMW